MVELTGIGEVSSSGESGVFGHIGSDRATDRDDLGGCLTDSGCGACIAQADWRRPIAGRLQPSPRGRGRRIGMQLMSPTMSLHEMRMGCCLYSRKRRADLLTK
jgi:hypothetical protein